MGSFFKKTIQFILKWCAKVYLLENKPYIIVIAGTTGRFWVKAKTVEALKERNFSVITNKKNFNAEIGLPLSILGLPAGERSFINWLKIIYQAIKFIIPQKRKRGPESFVLEMAIDRPENMRYLTSIVKPDCVVLTTITMIYQENFEGLDKIAAEYGHLVKALPWNGILVLNNDDERIKVLGEYFKGKVVTYGFNEGAHYKAFDVNKVIDGQIFNVEVKRKEREVLNKKINRFGRHHVYAELVKEAIKDNFKEKQREFFGKIFDAQ